MFQAELQNPQWVRHRCGQLLRLACPVTGNLAQRDFTVPMCTQLDFSSAVLRSDILYANELLLRRPLLIALIAVSCQVHSRDLTTHSEQLQAAANFFCPLVYNMEQMLLAGKPTYLWSV